MFGESGGKANSNRASADGGIARSKPAVVRSVCMAGFKSSSKRYCPTGSVSRINSSPATLQVSGVVRPSRCAPMIGWVSVSRDSGSRTRAFA